jgi:hypothetical protein
MFGILFYRACPLPLQLTAPVEGLILLQYYSVYKLLSLLTFLFIFDYFSFSKKFIIDFAMVCFINKDNSSTTCNFIYLNKIND